MKTKSLFFAVLVLMSAVALGAGKDEPRTGIAVIPVKGSEVFKLIYKGASAGKVKVSIYNQQAKLVFAETINAVSGFIYPLNFSGLAFGEYTIELVDAAGKKVEKVVYARQDYLKNVHISKISNAAGKYLLSVANTGNTPISVKIFDAKDNLIFSETKSIKGDFAQVYKLEDASARYTFQVSDTTGNTKTIGF